VTELWPPMESLALGAMPNHAVDGPGWFGTTSDVIAKRLDALGVQVFFRPAPHAIVRSRCAARRARPASRLAGGREAASLACSGSRTCGRC
jgi:hypothetical protein